jgi:hypothetical protein
VRARVSNPGAWRVERLVCTLDYLIHGLGKRQDYDRKVKSVERRILAPEIHPWPRRPECRVFSRLREEQNNLLIICLSGVKSEKREFFTLFTLKFARLFKSSLKTLTTCFCFLSFFF